MAQLTVGTLLLTSSPGMLRSTITFFFFNDTATTEIYTLSLHDALPISRPDGRARDQRRAGRHPHRLREEGHLGDDVRSEEHTSELQSPDHLVCRLLLEKKQHGRQEDPLIRPPRHHIRISYAHTLTTQHS